MICRDFNYTRNFAVFRLLHSLFNSNCASNCCTDHRVVAHADKSLFSDKNHSKLVVNRSQNRIQRLKNIRIYDAFQSIDFIAGKRGTRNGTRITAIQYTLFQ